MEIHLVHQADDGNLAVVALFFDEGECNAFLDQVCCIINMTTISN